MKKLFMCILIVVALSACKGTTKTGGEQADSGKTNVGNSGAADTTNAASSSTPMQSGTSGTDTSTNGKGTATPITDTPKTNPK
ncbi:MAG: hypothetical protein JWR05_865 [Mucilaginibacter sp.]|nr:hypothetical protein [Mucilaginibacter sp.]